MVYIHCGNISLNRLYGTVSKYSRLSKATYLENNSFRVRRTASWSGSKINPIVNSDCLVFTMSSYSLYFDPFSLQSWAKTLGNISYLSTLGFFGGIALIIFQIIISSAVLISVYIPI